MTSDESRPTDERGAILLVALFFAVFMVGMVYYVIGVAEAVLLSERMQDAVDAGALSGAVMSARAMNFIVLINLVMSVLLSILVAVKLVETLAIVGIILASALAYPTFGATLPLIPTLVVVREDAAAAYKTLKEPVETALEGLNGLATGVAFAAPSAAKMLAEEGVEEHWMPPVEFATVVPSRRPDEGLPVEDDHYPVLCGKAGEVVGELIGKPFEVVGVKELSDAISDLGKSTAETFSDWFCGSGGSGGSGGAPSIKTTEERHYPMLPSAQKCKDEKVVADCEDSNVETAAAKPDDTTGNCRAGNDCTLNGPYERSVEAARTDCDPTRHPAPEEYWWQEQTGTVEWTWDGVAWVRGETRIEETVRRHNDQDIEGFLFQPPCGPESVRPQIVGYELDPHPNDAVNEINPVCSEGGGPPILVVAPVKDKVYTQSFRRVSHILACRIDYDIEERGAQDDTPSESGSNRASKRIEGELELGDEAFQIRAFARRTPGMVGPGRGVRIALWGATEKGSELAGLQDFGLYAVAQAEFFYDGTGGADAWMWNMNWRGRLKRFRLPEDFDKAAIFIAACAAGDIEGAPGAGAFFTQIGLAKDLIMH